MPKRNIYVVAAILTPICLFYTLLARQTVNLPFLDDYSGVLGFLNHWVRINSPASRLADIFISQHNEYKLIFAQTTFVLQYLVSGRVNFSFLSSFGNLLILPLFVVLYGMWSADRRAISDKLAFFAPVSWILFQLQYYSLLNWPMSSLQHIAVILFSFLTIYLLSRDTERDFILSIVSLGFSIASSGNGLFIIPIGFLILLQFRRGRRLFWWAVASLFISLTYFHGYDFNRSQAHADHSIISSVHHISLTYTVAFLGASIARYNSYWPAAVLGVLLVLVFAVSCVDRFYRDNPAMFYSMLFILVTAFAVSGLRSDLGIQQSLVSRYRMYSNLDVIFAYLYLLGALAPRMRNATIRATLNAGIMCAAVLFSLASTFAGYKLLRIRTDLTIEGVRRWQHGQESITTAPTGDNEDPVIKRQRLNGNYEPRADDLAGAKELGIYDLPTTLGK